MNEIAHVCRGTLDSPDENADHLVGWKPCGFKIFDKVVTDVNLNGIF